MSRLDRAFLLLVVLPALVFAIGGIYVALASRAALRPMLDRHVAGRAVEYLRQERIRSQARLEDAREWLPESMAELRIERLSLYVGTSRVGTLPLDSMAVPLRAAAGQSEAMLQAARRGQTVLDFVRIEGRPVWLAYVPLHDRLAVAVLKPDPLLTERFRTRVGYDLAVYYGGALVPPSGGDWPYELPTSLRDSLASHDRPLNARLAGSRVAAAPIKDFDDWDSVGAAVVRRRETAARLPLALLFPPAAAMFVAGALTVIGVWRLASGRGRRPRRLGWGFARALLPPVLAAAWLATADAQISASATDALLQLSGNTVLALDDPLSLSTGDLAALAGTDVALARGTSIVAATSEIAIDAPRVLGRATGRLRTAGHRIAYRVVDMTAGERLVLLRAPFEDSRKGTLFWLAGLYGLLAASVLIFASLASASANEMDLREAITAWSFVSPSLALLLVFTAAPLLFALYLSFHSWNLLEPAKPFVGLQHYIELAGDSLFWNAAKNTAVYSLYVPISMACALAVAMLLNRRIKGVAVLRAIFFLPYITSFVAISIVWQWMYDPNFGLFNWALGLVGLGPFPWLNSPGTALLALIILAIWIHIGFQMVIFLAGLQAIPNELYEAATIDGAGAWRRFWKITLPLLRPTTFFVLVTSIIGSFQVFTFVYVMTEGGPLHATDVIVYHIYQNAWQFLRMGYASAMSWVLFAVIFLITLLQFRVLGRRITPS
ncbi:MAG: sugar ABC transporter permease [Gemmatimonadales bacterium]|jgi:ABC-type sugar transport system permease subunit